MNELAEIIRREIAHDGPIAFARFMELALYQPNLGYYEQEPARVGRSGDFYTSVGAGPLFGQLLAFQSACWLDALLSTAGTGIDVPGSLQLVEAGAHNGRLACDILSWFQMRRPELLDSIGYWIIEPSARRRQWQEQTLQEHREHVRWYRDWDQLPCPIHGVIFSNELLDAFPVHRLGWDANSKTWFEWGVDWQGDQFGWARLASITPCLRNNEAWGELQTLPYELLIVLPHEFTTEICPAARNWWTIAARSLRRGKLCTIDYGLTGEELLSPTRFNGTLRAYQKHHLSDDPLACVGEQDLTAHVNFSALQRVGEREGLQTEAFVSQAQFLTRIAERTWQEGAQFGEWTTPRRREFQTLTHPEHLGRPFRVLVQARG